MILPYDRIDAPAIHEYNIGLQAALKYFGLFIDYKFIISPRKKVNDNSQWQNLKVYT